MYNRKKICQKKNRSDLITEIKKGQQSVRDNEVLTGKKCDI